MRAPVHSPNKGEPTLPGLGVGDTLLSVVQTSRGIMTFLLISLILVILVSHFVVALGSDLSCSTDGKVCCPVNSSTVCPIFMSNNGFGCCNIPGAECCPMSATTQGCCPPDTKCVLTGMYSATCVPKSGGAKNISSLQVCTPGALNPPSSEPLPAVIYIGDSVSVGACPVVANLSSSFANVQHSPWSGGGAADDILNGLNCEDFYLHTAAYESADWQGIVINFGLHDLEQTAANKQLYTSGLTNFTDILMARQPRAKIAFVTTTPFMPLRYYNNTIVEDLNVIARTIMASRKIPVIDTYSAVIAHCGAVYSSCDICDNEPGAWPPNAPKGAHCGYHYTPAGWMLLGTVISNALKGIIGQSQY